MQRKHLTWLIIAAAVFAVWYFFLRNHSAPGAPAGAMADGITRANAKGMPAAPPLVASGANLMPVDVPAVAVGNIA